MGVSAMKVNQGEIINRGVEMTLGWEDKVGNWSYFVNGNAAYNKNWVADIGVTAGSAVGTGDEVGTGTGAVVGAGEAEEVGTDVGLGSAVRPSVIAKKAGFA